MRDPILPPTSRESFLRFIQGQARARRAGDRAPATRQDWERRRGELRERLRAAYGEFPAHPCPLEPRPLGVLQRDGYHIERLIFQSRPGIWVTANAYVPAGGGRRPAVLSVHGHWRWARVDPVPHARAVGLVKLGYFVLAVDAFGAGERAIQPGPGTYHGALLGAATWPAGIPLLGLQIYDNMRAVDYMLTRPEVDGDKLAITGASGGGNQSMNAGAWDERFKAVVPVCSIGTYDAYLGAACCVCEVLPGALSFAEEGDILALVAPRALMVVNATQDGHQFSVGEAAKSIARARPVFELLGAGHRIRHAIFESRHDYNKPMREALYGWLAKHLRGEGDASPIPEPATTLEEVDALRCFPDSVRPKEFTLLPAFVGQTMRRRAAAIREPDHLERWESQALLMRTWLERRVFGGFPAGDAPVPAESKSVAEQDGHRIESLVLWPEPEMPVPAYLIRRAERSGPLPTVLVIDPAGKDTVADGKLAATLVQLGWQVLTVDLRATGETAPPRDAIAGVPDHNSSEWSIWIGRPLLGQWCWDALKAIEFLNGRPDVDRSRFSIVGIGAAGLVAMAAAALDERVRAVATVGTLASFVTDEPFHGHRMAMFAPGLLEVADVAHLAALVAPRRLLAAAPVSAQSRPLEAEAARDAFRFTEGIYRLRRADMQFRVTNESSEDLVARSLLVVE
jgi:dienelactone hydrolase